MRAKKLMVLLIIPFLFGLCTNSALAWFNTPVQTSTLYMQDEPVAKMGTTTQYGYDEPAGDTNPHFYSALIADGCEAFGMLWYPELVKIEVSGTDPNGNPLLGDRFSDLTVLSSPDDSGVEQQILKIIYDYLLYSAPAGLRAIVTNTISAGGATTNRDSEKAWGKWQRPVWGLAKEERGLRFGYALVVDPTLEGTYTINIRYHAWICAYDGVISHHAGYIDLYDTVYYTYQTAPPPAPPYKPSRPSGPTSGYTGTTYTFYTSTTDPNGDDVRYEFDWDIPSSTIEIPVSEDSYVESYSPSTNYGSDPIIFAGAGEIFGNLMYNDGWLKFSLSSIPSGAYITDAKLWLYGRPTNDWWAGVCFSSDDSWSEFTITWNNEPNFGGIIDYFLITVTPENNYGHKYWGWDVTQTVKSEYTGDKTVSFVMVPVYFYNGGCFSSKENSDGNAPYLEVTFQEEPPQPPTGWYASGVTATASHSWSSPGTYNVKARAQDVTGLWSDWSLPLTVNIEPTLVTILNTLGFTNIQESTVETFVPGTYTVKLYAEFAGQHAQNELSWYKVGTTQYNLIFSGPEGNFGYVDPPIVKSITINGQFGLSFLTSEARYFTETSKNPDGIKHAMIYRNLDNPNMYLIGFEDQLGGGDQDYNDMVISLELVNRPPNTPSTPSGPTTVYRNVWYTYSTSTTDPDGDDVSYQFEFTGPDTNVSFTTGWYTSGQNGSITVQPSDPLGAYQIRVRAQDVHEQWSDWSPPLTVNLIISGWVSPTGHEVEWGWADPENPPEHAYDDNLDTRAKAGGFPIGTGWGGYCSFTLDSAISCDKIRFNPGCPYPNKRIQIDVHRGGAWVNVYDGTDYPAHDWMEVSFGEGQVDMLRARMYGGMLDFVLFYEFDFWEV